MYAPTPSAFGTSPKFDFANLFVNLNSDIEFGGGWVGVGVLPYNEPIHMKMENLF